MKVRPSYPTAPVGSPWTLAFGHHEDRTLTHGYAATREAAMAAFAKNWGVVAAGTDWARKLLPISNIHQIT